MQERRERERERVDMGAPSCSDWQKSAAAAARNLGHTHVPSVRAPRLVAAESNIEGTEPDEKTEPRDARWIELWDEGREGGGGARKESGRG